MAWPVPTSYPITTAYGKRGSYWSCQEDSNGNGVHTGADFACPSNTTLHATIAGTIRHRSYGSAFGDRQFAISPSPGQPFADGEVFYAHGNERLADGTEVQVGDYVGKSGARGNVSGPHLHYEFHPHTKNAWNCSVHADPAPTLEGTAGGDMGYEYWFSGKPSGLLHIGNEYKNMDIDEWDPPGSGLEGVLTYANCSNLTFHDGAGPGRIRVRLDRGDGDYSGYQDYVVTPGTTEMLITHSYFEKGDGTRTWVGFKALDNLAGFDIGTRYMKRWLIR